MCAELKGVTTENTVSFHLCRLSGDYFVQNKLFSSFFFLVSWGGVRLGLVGTSATIWSIVPAPDDWWWWMYSSWWKENWHGKLKYSEKTCPNATLFTTNPAWPDLGSNPSRRSGKPATNRLNYGTAALRLEANFLVAPLTPHGLTPFIWICMSEMSIR
jgi:hypothetical protein